jgi:hypothetical protein
MPKLYCQTEPSHTWHTARKLLQRLEQKGILKYVHRPKVKVDVKAHYTLRVESEKGETEGGLAKPPKDEISNPEH